jgi:hypothetical protein
LEAFVSKACVEVFDRRKQTLRCRAFGDAEDRGQKAYERAVQAAKDADVTLQDLCEGNPLPKTARSYLLGGGAHVTVTDHSEEYPIVVTGSHGMMWVKA